MPEGILEQQPANSVPDSITESTKFTLAMSHALCFVISIALAGICCGFGWQNDAVSFLGIIGLGIFLTWQGSAKKLIPCLLHALLMGYIGFLIANFWMSSTIEILTTGTQNNTFFISQLVHLLHAGIFVAFSLLWWLSRRFLRGGYFVAPAIWLILESIYPSMFPTRIATLIVDATPLVQVGSIFGVAGISLQVFLIACLIPLTWRLLWNIRETGPNRNALKISLAAIALLTIINFAWGWQRSQNIRSADTAFTGQYLHVGLIQGETQYATSHLEFQKRSRNLVANGAELVVWPECSLGKYQRDLVDFSDDTLVAQKSLGYVFRCPPLSEPDCHLLGGGYSWGDKDEQGKLTSRYVSALLIDTEEQLVGRHDKIELMAGGEYLPFESIVPQIRDWLGKTVDPDDPEGVLLSRGDAVAPLGTVKGVSIGTILCCEDMYPEISRQLVDQGADLIVCLSNGMAFDSQVALRQHFNLGRFRVVENNRYAVRCGSKGISGLMRPDGSLSQTLPTFSDQDAQLKVPVEHRTRSLYTQFGDLLTPSCYLMMVGLIGFSIFRGRHASDR